MQPIRMESNYDRFSSLLRIQDFDMLITMAIGSRNILHDEINQIYKENREVYYEYFKKSSYYEDKRLASLSVQNYQAIQQFIGIYIFEQSIDSTSSTMKLIKKGYRFVYNFVKNQMKVDFYKLRDDYITYVKRNSLEKNIHLAHLFGIALFLCKHLEKDVIYDEFDISLIRSSIDQVFLEIEAKPEETEETVEFLEQYRNLGVMKKDFQLPLKDLIVSINKLHSEQQSEEEMIHHEFYKGLSKIAYILQYCNINPLDIQNITNIDQSRLKEIISLCLSSIEMLDLREDVHSLLGTYLLIYALGTDYNSTKHNLIVTSQEEAQLELAKLKREYEGKIRSLEQAEEQRQSSIRHLTDSNKRLTEKVQELEKQLSKKEVQLQELSEKNEALKNNQDELLKKINLTPQIEELTEQEMASYLNTKKCIIVGGLKGWQEQLKEYIPTARFIQAEELNIDLDFLLKADLVFFNEAVNNHSMFERIKSKLENTTIPISYSGKNTNIRITLKKMYDGIK